MPRRFSAGRLRPTRSVICTRRNCSAPKLLARRQKTLVSQIERIMRRVGMPNGLSGVGLGADDVDALVAGTLPQHRVTKLSPRPATAEDLRQLFLAAMRYW